MKPVFPFSNCNRTPDAIRWFIVGAYQAGASEKEIASLTNLTRQTVGSIISHFKQTGVPNGGRRKRTDRTTETTTNESLSHYSVWSDSEQDYFDSSSDDDQYASNSDDTDLDLDIKKEEQDEVLLAWKQSLYFRRKGYSSATDTIDYVLYKGRKHEEKRISSRQKSQKKLQSYQRRQNGTNRHPSRSPSLSPHSNHMLKPKLEPTPAPTPSNIQSLYIPSLYSLINANSNNSNSNNSFHLNNAVNNITTNTTSSSSSSSNSNSAVAVTTSPSPPSSPIHQKSSQSMEEYQSISPLTSSSSSFTSPHASPSQDHQEQHTYDNNQSPRFKLWSRADDKILLYHVLTRMQRWDELDQYFEGRHSVVDCRERWDLLQHYLFKELKKAGTYNW